MVKYRVIVKPEDGEALSKVYFNSEEEADSHIAQLQASADEILKNSKHPLLIIVKEYMPKYDWVEDSRESIMM